MLWRTRVQVERHPCRREGIVGVGMKLLVGIDSLLELLLAHITPWADSVADDLDVKLGHSAQRGPEHAIKRNKEKTSFPSKSMDDRRCYVQ